MQEVKQEEELTVEDYRQYNEAKIAWEAVAFVVSLCACGLWFGLSKIGYGPLLDEATDVVAKIALVFMAVLSGFGYIMDIVQGVWPGSVRIIHHNERPTESHSARTEAIEREQVHVR